MKISFPAKRWLLCICIFGFMSNAIAQYTGGLTRKVDTSFNNNTAYISSKKTNPETAHVPAFQSPGVEEKKAVIYCNIGDRKLLLDAFFPAKKISQPRTAIIIIHGGGWRSGNRSQHHQLAQKLAALGFVCFTPEYRLSTEALFPAAVYDVKSVVRWARQNAGIYNIDTGKIVALGFSAGGEIAAFLGTTGNMPLFEGTSCNIQQPSHVNAVIDIDGTLSFIHPDGKEGDDSKRMSAATHWFGYSKKDRPGLWEAASPLTYVSAQTPPTLFINSSVPWMHAGREEYIKVLTAHNIYAEVQSFPEAPHSFCLFDPWFGPTVNYIDVFLKKVFNH